MRKLIVILVMMCCATWSSAQALYHKAYGDRNNPALVFLHGGPGGSSIDFELTTANAVAEKGFFVVVYDRRGEGRSDSDNALFTFQQTFDDLSEIYSTYGLRKATLIGYSFGGIVGARFARVHPEKVPKLVLVATPISLQDSFKTILETVSARANGDSTVLAQVDLVKRQDTASVFYSSGAFMLAMRNGLYAAAQPTEEAKRLSSYFMEHPETKAYMEQLAQSNYKNSYNPSMGFITNEKYTLIDITADLESLKGTRLYGIYGTEDGLFDQKHIHKAQQAVGQPEAFVLLQDCSHGVFMDQQEAFIKALHTWLNE